MIYKKKKPCHDSSSIHNQLLSSLRIDSAGCAPQAMTQPPLLRRILGARTPEYHVLFVASSLHLYRYTWCINSSSHHHRPPWLFIFRANQSPSMLSRRFVISASLAFSSVNIFPVTGWSGPAGTTPDLS